MLCSKANIDEMLSTIDKIYEPCGDMVKAINELYKLMCEKGLENDPRYRNAASMLIIAMNEIANSGTNLAIELCDKKQIIENVTENPIGRYLVKRAMKD